jgi:drug/metabolite transporter (DMT)-like permease
MTESQRLSEEPSVSKIRVAFRSPYLLLILAALCWSGNHVVGRALAPHMPPLSLAFVRWLFPALALWPLVRRYYTREWPLIRQTMPAMLFLTLSGGALFGALQYVGLQYTSALNVSVLSSMSPVLIAGAGALLFDDRLSWRQIVGIAASLGGVLVVVSRAQLTVLSELTFSAGDLIIIFNMLVLAVYSACLRLRPAIHWLSFLFALAVVSTLATLPFAIWELASGPRFEMTPLTAAELVYVAIFPGLVAFAAWNRGVEVVGPARAGVLMHLIPLFTALLATVGLGETLMPYHVLGFALILGGAWLAARRDDATG